MKLNIVNIKPDERGPVLLLFLQFFSVVAISITGGSARDAFFLNLFDRSYLPLMFVAIALTMVVVITLYKRLIDGRDSINVITISGLIFAITIYLIQLNLKGWLIPILFIWMEVIVSLSILQFWMLAGEIFDPRQAKRIFSIIGAGGSMAGILAGYSLKPFVQIFGSDKLLYLTIFFIFSSTMFGNLVKSYRKSSDERKSQKKIVKKSSFKKRTFEFDPYLKSIAILITVFIAKFSDQVFKFSVNNASQEILWLPVPKEKKKEAKPIIDSAVRATLEGVVGILIFLLVQFNFVPVDRLNLLSVLVIAGVLVWVWNSFRLKDGYVSTLMKAIEKRQLDLEDVEFDVTDNHIINTIDKTLRDKDEMKQLFGLDLLKNMPLEPWKNTLNDLFETGSKMVRRVVLVLSGGNPSIISNKLIYNLAISDDDLAAQAIAFAGERGIAELKPHMINNLNSNNEKLKAASATALLKIDINMDEPKEVLRIMLTDSSDKAIIAALDYLHQPMGVLTDELLIKFLEHDHSKIRESALTIAKHRGVEKLLEPIIVNLAYPKTAMQARQALSIYNQDMIFDELESVLKKEETDFFLRLGIIRCLRHFPYERSAQILMGLLDHDKLLLLSETVDSILGVARKTELSENFINEISQYLITISKNAYQLNLFRQALPKGQNGLLIRDHIDSEIRRTISILLKLGVLKNPNIPIETYIQYLSSGDSDLEPFVLEFVDTTFSPDDRKYTIPLIDKEIDISETSEDLFKDLIEGFDDLIMIWVYTDHQWKAAVALNYIFSSKREDLLSQIEWERIKDSIFLKEITIGREYAKQKVKLNLPDKLLDTNEEKQMYSILEKTILLKSVDLFKNIPGDVLTRIAQISEEERPLANTLLFQEGDFGDSMYVLVDGNVKVHKGDQHIVSLGKGTCLGEMALLDQEPRSADVTTEEDSTLLKISQDGFYELMAGNSEIMQQIIKLLSGRIRDTNAKIQELQSKK